MDIKKNGMLYALSFLFFFAFILSHFINTASLSVLWYVINIFCAAMGLILMQNRVNKELLFFTCLVLVTSAASYLLIGNISITKYAYMIIAVPVAVMLGSDKNSAKLYKLIFWIYFVILLLRIQSVGIGNDIFVSSSENYVSAYLLFPLVLYYVLAERAEEIISLGPAIGFFVICVIARGRGGILVSGLLLCLLIIYKICKKNRRRDRSLIILIFLLIVTLVVLFFVSNMEALAGRFEFLNHFNRSGFSSAIRLELWSNYLQTLSNPKYLLFGSKIADIPLIVQYLNNPHNSFINIHAYNGLLMLVIVLFICARNTIRAFKNKRWVYIICFAVFCIRGLTDYLFWGAYGEVIFFIFLFEPMLYKKKRDVA